PHEIPVAKALVENIARKSGSQLSTLNYQLSFDPYSYQRRATEKIERNGFKHGGDELIRVVVRQANFDKIAHKIDRMGDYKPETIYENANVVEIDPRDDIAISNVNDQRTPQFVTISDDLDLSVIAAFRLLAARLQARHPILLKDAFNCRPSVSDANQNDGVSQSGAAGTPATQMGSPKDEARGSERIKRPTDFLETLLTASTNIGSLLCDGIGDAILVQGEE